MTWSVRVKKVVVEPAKFVIDKEKTRLYYGGKKYAPPVTITVDKNEYVGIAGSVKNIGGQTGTCEIGLIINGKVVKTTTRTISPGESADFMFNIKVDRDMDIEVAVRRSGSTVWEDTYG